MTNNETKLKISVSDLQTEMYVCELDRSWLETPYVLQGILIRSRDDIDELAHHCAYVYVDIEKSNSSVIQKHMATLQKTPKTNGEAQNSQNNQRSTEVPKTPFRNTAHPLLDSTYSEAQRTPFHGEKTYTDTHTVEEELPAAKQASCLATNLMEEINTNLERNGELNIGAAHDTVNALRESVIRNPDAMLLLSRLKTTGRILYDNAVNASVHLLAFGRHLGLPREELSKLGLGGLLMDIGKMRLPPELITKNNSLNAADRNLMKQHVAYGEEIIAQSNDIPQEVLEIVAQHHEREGGNGYPRSLNANQLHAYARMAAIVDCYEEFIGVKPDFPPVSAFQAFVELKELSRSGLNAMLVEQFAHCIGMFPVGSLVELNTGEVAIVLSHGRTKRFLPNVMIILDAKKQPYDVPLTLNLRSAGPAPSGIQYAITHDLPQNAYGIDAKQYYL